MNEDLEKKINDVLAKLSMDERRYLAQLIGGECNYFIVNYLEPKSAARIEAIGTFTEYLQEAFDHMDARTRTLKIMDEAFSEITEGTHLRRVK